MEHNTNRILWTVLVLAIGVALYVGFRPAANGLPHQVVDKTHAVMTNAKSNTSDSSSDSSGTVDSSSNSDFTYSDPDTKDDTISITGYKGKSANPTIPTYRKIGSVDYKVTAIGYHAFANTGLTSVNIPDSVTSIGMYAFSDNPLKSLTLGSGVTSIGEGSFCNNRALTRVDIPDSVKSIGNFAFSTDSNLKSLTLGSGVTSIGNCAFLETQLTSIGFPANLKSIGNFAFDYTSMSAISFKKPIDLGIGTFGNTKLTNVTLPTGSTYHTDADNQTFDSNVNVTVK